MEDLAINQLNSKIVRGAGAGQNTFPNGMALSNYAFDTMYANFQKKKNAGKRSQSWVSHKRSFFVGDPL